MRKIVVVILTILFCQNLYAQENSGIEFTEDLTWQQIVAKANNENKLIFIDLYTTWCQPCKRLESDIFPLPLVGEKFNQHFINVRIDAEKGEGVELAKKFRVSGYPYLVFANSKGEMVFSTLGYKNENDLLTAADKAIGEAKSDKPFAVWEKEYDSNYTSQSWLKEYIQKRNTLRLDNRKYLQDYYDMLQEEDYMEAENLQLIIGSTGLDIDSKLLQLISQNFRKIKKEDDDKFFLQAGLVGIFDVAINSAQMPAIKENDENVILTKVAPLYEKLWPETVNGMPWYSKQDGDMWKFIFYRETKNVGKFVPVAERYLLNYYFKLKPKEAKEKDAEIYALSKVALEKQGMDPESEMIKQMLGTYCTNDHMDRLLGASYMVLENTTNRDTLRMACNWALRAIEINPSVAAYEANAKLLMALNDKVAAIKNYEEARKLSISDEEKSRLVKIIEELK